MNQSFISTPEQLFRTIRMKSLLGSFVHPPFEYERELMEAVRIGDENKALSVMEKINQLEGAMLAADPVRSKKNSLIASCTLFTRTIIQGGVDPETAFQLSDAFIQSIEKIAEIERLAKFEYDMMLQFIAVMKKEKASMQYSHLINRTVYFIYENIFQDISLDRISRFLNVHPCYLSDRFKQETGTTITAFINHKKIEESKYFLANTNISVSEIAQLFHFCNQSYYSYLFKKTTGKTPKQFRKEALFQ